MPTIPVLVVAIFFLSGGIGHFVFADFFIMAMPDYLGYHWELVIISGIFELLGAIGILYPPTRLWAGYGLIALCIAVFPANINMALHPENYPDLSASFLYIRLPFQAVFIAFIAWAVKPEWQAKRRAKQA